MIQRLFYNNIDLSEKVESTSNVEIIVGISGSDKLKAYTQSAVYMYCFRDGVGVEFLCK